MLMVEVVGTVSVTRVWLKGAMDELAAHTEACGLCWTGACTEGNTLLRRAARLRKELDRRVEGRGVA